MSKVSDLSRTDGVEISLGILGRVSSGVTNFIKGERHDGGYVL